MEKKILGVIPARFKSTRFPGKPLVDINGKPMIQWVYERAVKSTALSAVLVATDDERIYKAVESFGGKVTMTSESHPSGTDRLLEVAGRYPHFDAYVNVQGDEPLIDPRQIDQLCQLLESREGAFVGTLIKKLDLDRELNNPNVIKVVRDLNDRALYFSRSPIPHLRPPADPEDWHAEHGFFKHIGMYGYSSASIGAIREMERSVIEIAESLEQLRWMVNGLPIFVAETTIETKGVDAPEDLGEVLDLMTDLGM